MKIKASELHCIAILANYWLVDKSDYFFKDEKKIAKKIRKFCSEFDDEDELLITELPF